MISWLRRFFTDETAFTGYIRAGLLVLGAVATQNEAAFPGPDWIGPAIMGAAGFIRAGDKNPKGLEPRYGKSPR